MSHADSNLTAQQQAMVALWEQHVDAEFVEKNALHSCDKMVADAYVNHVPTQAGGHGREQLEHFYGKYFIPHLPPDIENVLVSRTVGSDQIVDELILRFTHTTPIDWLLPGVAPTGKRVELALVVVIAFKDGKMHHEHIYWDQASALAQIGLLDAERLPIVGAAGAHKVQQPQSVPPNGLLKRFVDDPLL